MCNQTHISKEQVQQKIESHLQGAKVEILDPRGDGRHLKALVTYKGFLGKPMITQHRMVYDALKEELKGELHSLSVETRVN